MSTLMQKIQQEPSVLKVEKLSLSKEECLELFQKFHDLQLAFFERIVKENKGGEMEAVLGASVECSD